MIRIYLQGRHINIQVVIKFLPNPSVGLYKEADRFAFKQVLRKCYELNIKGGKTYFTEFLKTMRDFILSKNAIMGDLTQKYLERNFIKQCTDI